MDNDDITFETHPEFFERGCNVHGCDIDSDGECIFCFRTVTK
jgi:hypothetical protein